MREWFQEEWFTLVSILLSGLISWVISAIYFRKGNRSNLQMSVLFPILNLLSDTISRKNYIEIKELSSSYSTKFLSKDEKQKLYSLVSEYRVVCNYNENSANATAVVSYFEYVLKKNDIEPRIVPVYEEGEIIYYDYPPDFNFLQTEVEKVFDNHYLEIEPDVCKEEITFILMSYAREYYTQKELSIFDDYDVETVIQKSIITDKWNRKFKKFQESKKEFEKLKIVKGLLSTSENID